MSLRFHLIESFKFDTSRYETLFRLVEFSASSLEKEFLKISRSKQIVSSGAQRFNSKMFSLRQKSAQITDQTTARSSRDLFDPRRNKIIDVATREPLYLRTPINDVSNSLQKGRRGKIKINDALLVERTFSFWECASRMILRGGEQLQRRDKEDR